MTIFKNGKERYEHKKRRVLFSFCKFKRSDGKFVRGNSRLWKNPLEVIVHKDDVERFSEAIEYFTNCTPTKTELDNNKVLLEAEGKAAADAKAN